jgi:cobalt-zinc-cadmium efflux system membrane fusion protein
MKPRIIVSLFIFSFLVASCSNSDNNSGQSEGDSETKVQPTKGAVVLSARELENTSIEIGALEKKPISDAISCFGTLSALPKQLISITTPMGGRIKELNFLPGDYVKKGSVMASLEDLGAIQLQQNFLEAKAELKYAKEDYKRQGQLTVEDAASVKKMQDAEATYWKAKARFESLKEQLAILDMDIAAIEKGNIQSHIVLRSPISGYVSMLNGNLGRFVEARTEVYQVVDISHLQAHMQIYQRSIARIKPGMKMQFEIVGVPGTVREARLKNVGQMMQTEEQSFSVHATIKNEGGELKPGMKIQGEIFLDEKEYYTIHSEGVVNYDGNPVVFIQKDNRFIPVQVTKGPQYGQWVALVNPDERLKGDQVVLKGAYYLVGQLWTQAE